MEKLPKINIIYEDNHLLVVEKPINIPVCEDESKDLDLLTILKQYIKERYNKPGNVYLGLVHRLDRPVGGIMVFAKTSKAASRLSELVRTNLLHKNYLAIVHGKTLDKDIYEEREENVFIAKSAKIYPNTYIAAPAIIGENTEVRPGAFISGNALIGAGCVVGNSTEVNNAILFDGAQAPHYNYIGDSILGYKAHTGAGAITSNLKQDHSSVTILAEGERIQTGMRKFGAILGDGAEVGCGGVLNPGTVIGRGARIYPLSMVRGFVPGFSIYKRAGEIAAIHEN